MAPHGQQPQQPRRRQRADRSSSSGGGDAGGQQGVRKRPRPDHQPPVGTEEGKPHFVYTLFPGTVSLEAFLTPRLPPAHALLCPDDDAAYLKLLRGTLVAPLSSDATAAAPAAAAAAATAGPDFPPPMTAVIEHESYTIDDVLDRITIADMQQQAQQHQQHASHANPATAAGPSILTLGYRRVASEGDHGMVALGGVQCDHVNSLRDELRTPPWKTLLRRIGGPCLQQLLGRHMLLRPLQNGSYLQLSGPPLPSLLARPDVAQRYQAATARGFRGAGKHAAFSGRAEAAAAAASKKGEPHSTSSSPSPPARAPGPLLLLPIRRVLYCSEITRPLGLKKGQGALFPRQSYLSRLLRITTPSNNKASRVEDDGKGKNHQQQRRRRRQKELAWSVIERIYDIGAAAASAGGKKSADAATTATAPPPPATAGPAAATAVAAAEGMDEGGASTPHEGGREEEDKGPPVAVGINGTALLGIRERIKARKKAKRKAKRAARIRAREAAAAEGEEELEEEETEVGEGMAVDVLPRKQEDEVPPPSASESSAFSNAGAAIAAAAPAAPAAAAAATMGPAARRRLQRGLWPLLTEMMGRLESFPMARVLGKLCPLPPAFQRLSSAPRTSAASPGPARTTARAPFPVEEESGEEDGYLTQGEEEKGAELGYRRSHTWGTAAPASEPAIQQLEEQLDEEELLEEPGDVDDDVEQALLDRILEQATPPEQVAAFLRSCLRHLLPPALLGSPHNTRLFIDQLLAAYLRDGGNTRAALNPSRLARSLRLTDVAWTHASPTKNNKTGTPSQSQPRSTPADRALQLSLLEPLVAFLVGEVALPVLKASFFATEADGTGLQLHFFRQPVWRAVLRLARTRVLLAGQYERVPSSSLSSSSSSAAATAAGRAGALSSSPFSSSGGDGNGVLPLKLGLSAVRLVPKKKGGLRIITDHARPPLRVEQAAAAVNKTAAGMGAMVMPPSYPLPPVNRALAHVYQALKFELAARPSLGGIGVLGLDAALPKVAAFAQQLKGLPSFNRNAEEGGVPSFRQPPSSQSDRQAAFCGCACHGADGDGGRLYMAAVDVERCYDHIRPHELLGRLRGALAHERYHVRRCAVSHPFRSRHALYTDHRREAYPEGGWRPFPEIADELSRRYKGAVVTDGVVEARVTRTEAFALLEEYLLRNTVYLPSYGHDLQDLQEPGEEQQGQAPGVAAASGSSSTSSSLLVLRQVRGISQGSVLSPALCHLYLGSVESNLLKEEEEEEEEDGEEEEGNDRCQACKCQHASMALRLVDDYLCVTTSLKVAKRFLDRVYTRLPAIGMRVHPHKTRANFEHAIISPEDGGEQQEPPLRIEKAALEVSGDGGAELFPWCGLLFNTRDCQVTKDYGRESRSSLREPVAFDAVPKRGLFLQTRLKALLKPRLPPLALCPLVTARPTALLVLYEAFLFTALKARALFRELPLGIDHDPAFLLACIDDALRFAHTLVRRRAAAAAAPIGGEEEEAQQKQQDPPPPSPLSINHPCPISLPEALYLGHRAFLAVFEGRDPVSAAAAELRKEKKRKRQRRKAPAVGKGERALVAGLRARWEAVCAKGPVRAEVASVGDRVSAAMRALLGKTPGVATVRQQKQQQEEEGDEELDGGGEEGEEDGGVVVVVQGVNGGKEG